MKYSKWPLVAIALVMTVGLFCGTARALNEAVEVAFERGLSAFEDNGWGEALKYFDEAIAADPNYAPAHHYRGVTLLKLDQPTEAIKALEKARDLDPNAVDVHLDLGLAYFKAGRGDDALAEYREEVRLHPDNARAQFSLGYALMLRKEYEKALEPFGKAGKLDPELAAASRFYEGSALMALSRKDEARQAFKDVLAMNPPEDIASASRDYLSAIDQGAVGGKSWAVVGTVLYQWDSNVIAANDQMSFPINIMGSDISNQEDSRAVVTLYGRWRFLDRNPWQAEARYMFYQSFHFKIDQFNLQNHSPEILGSRSFTLAGKQASASLGYRADVALLGSDVTWYSVNHWVAPALWIKWNESLSSSLSYRLNLEDFHNDEPNRDNTAHGVILESYWKFLGKKGLLTGGVGYDFEDAEDENYDVHRPWVRLCVDMFLPLKFQSRLTLYYENANHFSSEPHRIDDIFSTEFLLIRPVWGPIEANVNVNYRLNNSTVDVFQYDRTIVGGGLSVRF